MPAIYIGEHCSPHIERLAGVAVGFDEDNDLRVVTTIHQLAPLERRTIADRLDRIAAHLREGQRHPEQ